QAQFGGDTPLGRRRTVIGAAPAIVEIQPAALVEREPVTVLCSQKGWIRAVKGHGVAAADQATPEPRPAALVEREPVTVLCSQKGWIRAVKGHGVAAADQKYKEG